MVLEPVAKALFSTGWRFHLVQKYFWSKKYIKPKKRSTRHKSRNFFTRNMRAVAGIRTRNLLSHAYLPYHLTYIAIMIEWKISYYLTYIAIVIKWEIFSFWSNLWKTL
jgi:hypothetical protein